MALNQNEKEGIIIEKEIFVSLRNHIMKAADMWKWAATQYMDVVIIKCAEQQCSPEIFVRTIKENMQIYYQYNFPDGVGIIKEIQESLERMSSVSFGARDILMCYLLRKKDEFYDLVYKQIQSKADAGASECNYDYLGYALAVAIAATSNNLYMLDATGLRIPEVRTKLTDASYLLKRVEQTLNRAETGVEYGRFE